MTAEAVPEPVNESPSKAWTTFDERLKRAENTLVEHATRLGNGMEVMREIKMSAAELRSEVREVERRLAPKPVDWRWWFGTVFAIVVALMGAMWGISAQLSARPTIDQVKDLIRTTK
jgi:hypothetical protein